MLNKKINKKGLIKFAMISSAVLLLAGCDVIAKPAGYDTDKILEIQELQDSQMNNMYSTIYDAMHDSSTLGTTTINIINEKLFEHYFGKYDEIEKAYKDKNYTALIDAHKAYQELDEKGTRLTTADAKNLEVQRVIRTYERMQNLISDKFYTSLNSNDYQNLDGLFSERLFALGVYKKLYTLDPKGKANNWNDFEAGYDFYEPTLLLPYTDLFDDEETKLWDDNGGQMNPIVHISSIDPKNGDNESQQFGYYGEYIKAEILPQIYQHMLSQYYIYNKEYSTLGSKYARKVTYIQLSPNSEDEYSTKHTDLIETFARNNVLNGKETDLYMLERAWVGYNIGKTEKALLENAGFEVEELEIANDIPALNDDEKISEFATLFEGTSILENDVLTYYKGTLFGNIIEEFIKIIPGDIAASSKSAESKFSGSNTYSYIDGLKKEIKSLLQKNIVTEGWGLKSDGFASLDSSIKARLMSINVAADLKVPADGQKYSSNYLQYVAESGKFYLLPEKRMADDEISFVLNSSTTRVIVEVEEAASVAKLSKRESSADKYDTLKAEDVAYEICNLLADGSTVKTSAMQYFLEESELLYHDDKILEYFKENYPDLFKDKK